MVTELDEMNPGVRVQADANKLNSARWIAAMIYMFVCVYVCVCARW